MTDGKDKDTHDHFGLKDEVDLLMKEYVALRSEIVEFVRCWRAHARYSGIILGVVVALVSIAAKSDSGFALA